MTVQKDSPTKVVLTFSGKATTAGEQTLTIDSRAFAEAYNNAEVKIDVKAQPTGTVTAALKSGGPLKKDDASTNAVVILTIESDSGLAFSDELPAEQFTLSGDSKGSLAVAAPTKKTDGTTAGLTLTGKPGNAGALDIEIVAAAFQFPPSAAKRAKGLDVIDDSVVASHAHL